MTPRYGFQARAGWIVRPWVVVDRATGETVSKYWTEAEAKAASTELNVKRRGRF